LQIRAEPIQGKNLWVALLYDWLLAFHGNRERRLEMLGREPVGYLGSLERTKKLKVFNIWHQV
jgi:hypothetical protein